MHTKEREIKKGGIIHTFQVKEKKIIKSREEKEIKRNSHISSTMMKH